MLGVVQSMEIKLNQYTLPLLCSLVSAVTYIIIYCTKTNGHGEEGRAGKVHGQSEDSNDEDESDNSEPNYYIQQARGRRDSVVVHRRRLSSGGGDMVSNIAAANDTKLFNESDSEESDKYDEFETDDPAQLLEARQKRSRQPSGGGAGGRRGTIAFEDELRATIKKNLSVERDCNVVDGIDKSQQKCATSTISTLEPKSILKTASDMASEGEYCI